MSAIPRCAVAACLALGVRAQTPDWARVRDSHFEVYSQAGEKSAAAGLAWLEDLRSFVARQTGLTPETAEPVRVIAFRSPAEYAPFRLQSLSDAYYVGSGTSNYLVLPSLDPASFGTAAHEYAHCLFRIAGIDLPSWLREGVSEVFASVRMTRSGAIIGGDLPARAQLLQHKPWLPLSRILAWPDAPLLGDRDAVEMFYSESWALAEMLALAPQYQPGFRRLVAAVAGGMPGEEALQRIYGKSLDRIEADLRGRAGHRTAVPLTAPSAPATQLARPTVAVSTVSWFDVRLMLASVMVLVRDYERANSLYAGLAREAPGRADVTAGLGAVAFARGDRDEAGRLWKQAIAQGLADAGVSYQYALLLDSGDAVEDDLRSALQLTVRLRPRFEDARFRLALLEENTGHFDEAVAQFQAIAKPAPAHAYNYWCSFSQALLGLGRNADAAEAGQNAAAVAPGAVERAHALQLVRMARTHLGVQFTRDETGQLKLTTTRVENGDLHWNAFVEPGDEMRRAEGTLREIECADSGLRLLLETASGRIAIAIPDPSHVEMRNAPSEFVCGAQEPSRIIVDYAASKGAVPGVARGIEFVRGEK